MSDTKSAPPIPHIVIYTDGACKGNPGPGGWGALLRCAGVEKSLCGGEAVTTNNKDKATFDDFAASSAAFL